MGVFEAFRSRPDNRWGSAISIRTVASTAGAADDKASSLSREARKAAQIFFLFFFLFLSSSKRFWNVLKSRETVRVLFYRSRDFSLLQGPLVILEEALIVRVISFLASLIRTPAIISGLLAAVNRSWSRASVWVLETPDETSAAMHDATDKYEGGGGKGREGKRGRTCGVQYMRESPRGRTREGFVFVRTNERNGSARTVLFCGRYISISPFVRFPIYDSA